MMGWSKSTNEGWYLFVVCWFRNYFEFLSDLVEDEAYIYLVLIINVKEGKCHLDKEVQVCANNVARDIDTGGKKLAQVIEVQWCRRAFKHLSLFQFQYGVE